MKLCIGVVALQKSVIEKLRDGKIHCLKSVGNNYLEVGMLQKRPLCTFPSIILSLDYLSKI